jgi:hypothetical protein
MTQSCPSALWRELGVSGLHATLSYRLSQKSAFSYKLPWVGAATQCKTDAEFAGKDCCEDGGRCRTGSNDPNQPWPGWIALSDFGSLTELLFLLFPSIPATLIRPKTLACHLRSRAASRAAKATWQMCFPVGFIVPVPGRPYSSTSNLPLFSPLNSRLTPSMALSRPCRTWARYLSWPCCSSPVSISTALGALS